LVFIFGWSAGGQMPAFFITLPTQSLRVSAGMELAAGLFQVSATR